MGFSLGGAISGAASWVGSKVEGAVEEGEQAIAGAQQWVGDRLDDVDHAEQWVGGKIDGAVQGAEHAVDGFRNDLVQFGEQHGGVVGGAVAQAASSGIGVVEGAGLAVYDMGKGIVQLADGAGKLINPLEWATHGTENLQRLQNVGKAAETLGNLTSPVAWATNPQANVDTAKALWNGVTAGYQDAAKQGDWSKFIGRGVVDIGSLFIGAGEANAAIKGAEGANAVAKIGEGANALDHVADGAKALDAAADAGKAAKGADAADAVAALSRAETAVKGGDLALAGKTIEAQRTAITALVEGGRVGDARALLKPLLDAGDYDGLVARLDVSSPAGKTYFWSGNAKEAERIATGAGGRTLESTPGGRILDGWKDIPAWKDGGKDVWGAASKQFAQDARGDVTIVLTRDKATTRGGDTWRNVESEVVRQLRVEGVVTGIKVVVLDPLNPTKLIPLTGLAAEAALREAGLPTGQ